MIPNHADPANPRSSRHKINTDTTTHALPEQVQAEAGQAVWDAAFKFTEVRSPRVLRVSFRKVALRNPAGSRLPLADTFTDFVRGFGTVCDTLSLPRKPLLHMHNKGPRPAYRDHDTPETRDIDFFGHQF